MTATNEAPATDPTGHRALYRRFRAQTFDGIVGQEAVVETLRNAVRGGKVAHAILLVGPRGTGKTSIARILAKAINCTALDDGQPCDACPACVSIREGRALDVTEMDAASNNRVDDMRELLSRTATAPSDLRRKVYIVDEVQRITQGWDVLLRTLEEPPDHVVFIFCTTDASQIRPAVLSRVQRYDFRRLTVPEIEGKLRRILETEGRAAEPEALTLIARLASGGMRDAESMLDQLLASGAASLTADRVRDLLGLADDQAVAGFIAALVGGDALAGLRILDDLEARGRDARAFLDQVVERLRTDLTAALSATPAGSVDAAPLVAAGRRLATVDPAAAGPGGLRFQLEMVLLDGPRGSAAPVRAAAAAPAPVAAPDPAPVAPEPAPTAAPDPEPAEPARGRTKATEPVGVPVVADPEPEPAAALPEPEPDPAPTAADPEPEPAAALPEPEPDPAPDAPAAGAAPDLDVLRARWTEIVTHISAHPPTKPLISACRPISVEGNVVTLGFPEGQAFLRDVAERRRTVLEEGVGKFLEREVVVRCVATNLDLVTPPGDDEAGERLLAEAKRIFAEDIAEVREVE